MTDFETIIAEPLPSMDDVFGTDGWLSKHFKGYKVRPGQLELAQRVLDCLQSKTHFLAEGPTGTGKSLAYGIPAALLAVLHRRQTVIATANITLQEQLFKKDLPLIADLLAANLPGREPLKFQLVKGRSNYICHTKMDELSESGEALGSDWYQDIGSWYKNTKTGDKSELPVEYPGLVWAQVSSKADECLHGACPNKDDCFVYRARNQAADVVVTNYHMLYSDAQVRQNNPNGGILPDYNYLIMDEVHEAADIAQSFCGFELCEAMFHRLARKVGRVDLPTAKVRAADLGKCARNFFTAVKQLRREKIFQEPMNMVAGHALVESLDKASSMVDMEAVKYADKVEALYDQGRVDEAKSVKLKGAKLVSLIRVLISRVAEINYANTGDVDGNIPKGTVFYTERKEGTPWLCCKVVEVQPFMVQHFFSTTPTVGVSATVATGNSKKGDEFNFISRALGLDELGFDSLVVESPFKDRNFMLVIPEDMPSPKEQEDHSDNVCMLVEDVVKGIGGRTMVLCTSHRAVHALWEYLSRHLPETKILMQGDMPKMRIISEFKRSGNALILATNSFWQGVDIQGDDLSCVIIDKLPFAPPTDPVLQYWDQEYSKQKGSAFFKFSIPKAIIALKQGGGRLIRSEEDYGAVILCDNRVVKARYGTQFEAAFPSGRYQSDDIEDAIHFINKRRGT